MPEFLEVVNIIGVIGTVLISTTTLFTTRALQRSQQKATIMATKRSERIDQMREFSAGIISCGNHILYGIGDKETKKTLICYANKFISLLQYAYPHDVELINCVNRIVRLSLRKAVNKSALRRLLRQFWKKCDIYVGVEHERLKNESMGDINGSGKIGRESQSFEEIYTVLSEKQKEFLALKK